MMKYNIVLFFFTLLFFVRCNNFGPRYPPTRGAVWPKPISQKSEDFYYFFDIELFHVHVSGQTCKILTDAIRRYFYIDEIEFTLSDHSTKSEFGYLTSLEVNVKKPCYDDEYPYFGMDESYDLTVEANVKLCSPSVWGAIRGLETLFQLFYLTDTLETRINRTVINDAPRYIHRGLQIDTSRHYISRDNILTTIDAMAMNKMNVLHWHIVDDQSFPYQSEKFPNLSRLGAYHSTLVYTKEDIKTIVEFARARGIRVIAEIDVPGHTRSWGEAHPEVLSGCYRDGSFVDFGPMNPIVNVTYEMLRELFAEVQDWFPDKYFHIGGDEVDLNCWTSDPTIKQYMKDHGIKTAEELHAMFMEKAIPLLDHETIPIVWQILDAGYKVLHSAAWYLTVLSSGGDWEKFYKADPRDMVKEYFTGDKSYLLENIVGGEACIWGEYVDDHNIISRVWPRASAVAEKLWSPATPTDDIPLEVYQRLEEHACRMKRRGVRAQPPNGPGFCIGVV